MTKKRIKKRRKKKESRGGYKRKRGYKVKKDS
jgi:hypothetical protein